MMCEAAVPKRTAAFVLGEGGRVQNPEFRIIGMNHEVESFFESVSHYHGYTTLPSLLNSGFWILNSGFCLLDSISPHLDTIC